MPTASHCYVHVDDNETALFDVQSQTCIATAVSRGGAWHGFMNPALYAECMNFVPVQASTAEEALCRVVRENEALATEIARGLAEMRVMTGTARSEDDILAAI